ncbi:hypothetical protein C0J52_21663 [Blattella germanica]|nr:hypothetical protein C0J52_21663 [Blattella germanica]
MRPPWINDYDGQMMSGDQNLTQETCPDRESNPGPLRERRICYPLLHSVVIIIIIIIIIIIHNGCEID